MENRMTTKNRFPPTPVADPTQKTMDWLVTNRPSGAVGAEGAGKDCQSGGTGGGGPPTGQAPRPPCVAVFATRYGGRGRRSKPGSVAVWTCARLVVGVHGRTSCHADRGHRQHGSFAISTR